MIQSLYSESRCELIINIFTTNIILNAVKVNSTFIIKDIEINNWIKEKLKKQNNWIKHNPLEEQKHHMFVKMGTMNSF
jgi:hypothetical protein